MVRVLLGVSWLWTPTPLCGAAVCASGATPHTPNCGPGSYISTTTVHCFVFVVFGSGMGPFLNRVWMMLLSGSLCVCCFGIQVSARPVGLLCLSRGSSRRLVGCPVIAWLVMIILCIGGWVVCVGLRGSILSLLS